MYPRPREHLLPTVLRPAIGTEVLPSKLCSANGLEPNTQLSALDEAVWERLSPAAVDSLASEVVRTAKARWREILPLRDPIAVTSLRVSDVDSELSNRARNRFRASGWSGEAELRSITVAELAAARQIGAKILLEILTVVEAIDRATAATDTSALGPDTIPKVDLRPSPSVDRAAGEIARKRWSKRVLSGDPRLGKLVKKIDATADNAQVAALNTVGKPVDQAESRLLGGALSDLSQQAEGLRRLLLQDELHSLIAAIVPAENGQQMVRDRIGLGGQAPMTLQEAGDRAGVTRERVRQVEQRFRDAVQRCPPWTPVLDQVLKQLRAEGATQLSRLWRGLEERRLVDSRSSPGLVLAAAEALNKDVGVVIDHVNDLIAPGTIDGESEDQIASRARALITHWGATTIDELLADIASRGFTVDEELARLLVQRIDGFNWLDETAGWFWLRGTPRNRLLNQIEKIMSVAGSIAIGELRDGVGRWHRMQGFRPPRKVLAALCEQTGLYRQEGDRIIGGTDLPDWAGLLGSIERAFVDALFTDGPLMRRDDLEEVVVDKQGVNRSSFYVYLSYSPVIQRFAPGVYGLRGTEASAAQVDALIPPKVRSQVLQDHGWTQDGQVWVAYRVSPASSHSGVVSTPGALKAIAHGEFELFTEDGRTVGRVVVDDSTWGLSPFFRRQGVEAGDYVVLQFSLQERLARVFTGGSELLLQFQNAE